MEKRWESLMGELLLLLGLGCGAWAFIESLD